VVDPNHDDRIGPCARVFILACDRHLRSESGSPAPVTLVSCSGRRLSRFPTRTVGIREELLATIALWVPSPMLKSDCVTTCGLRTMNMHNPELSKTPVEATPVAPEERPFGVPVGISSTVHADRRVATASVAR